MDEQTRTGSKTPSIGKEDNMALKDMMTGYLWHAISTNPNAKSFPWGGCGPTDVSRESIIAELESRPEGQALLHPLVHTPVVPTLPAWDPSQEVSGLGDNRIPLAIRINWVWSKVAKIQPNFKREHWAFNDDPHQIYAMVADDACGFRGFSGAKVMDIGANMGVFTAMCALNGSHVTAYEANHAVFDILLGQIQKIGLTNQVAAVNAAIWTETGPVTFKSSLSKWDDPAVSTWEFHNGCVLMGQFDEQTAEHVNGISLDDAIGDKEWDCIKMDIEGAEFKVLMAASDEALKRVKFFTIELHNGWADLDTYKQLIARMERVFSLAGTIDGNPEVKSQHRYISLFATRK